MVERYAINSRLGGMIQHQRIGFVEANLLVTLTVMPSLLYPLVEVYCDTSKSSPYNTWNRWKKLKRLDALFFPMRSKSKIPLKPIHPHSCFFEFPILREALYTAISTGSCSVQVIESYDDGRLPLAAGFVPSPKTYFLTSIRLTLMKPPIAIRVR